MPVDIITKSSADVISDVQRAFGDDSGFQITTADIVRWINNAQMEIVMRNPELLPKSTLINIVAAQTDYPILANIPTVMTIQSVHYNGRILENKTFQEAELYLLKGANAPVASGDSIYWWERDGTIVLYPAPPAAITNGLKVYFLAKPTVITGVSQTLGVPDYYYNAIVDFCLEQAYILDENTQLAQVAGNKFDQAVSRLANRTKAQNDSYPFITIVDDWIEDTFTGFAGPF